MIILTLRTDNPKAEVALYNDEQQLTEIKWEAHRQLAETLHGKIRDILAEQNLELADIKGIVCFEGPGSFTGLRIGLSVANALAASLPAAIVGGSGKQWQTEAIQKLIDGQDQKMVTADYGAPVHITQRKK